MKTLFPLLGIGFLALSPLACGKKDNFAGSASVSGKVLLEKDPLPYGSVQFYGPELVFTALIQNDGSYKLDHMPEGPVTICVRTRGELFSDSRGEEDLQRRMREGMKGSDLPEGMTVEEFKQKMMEMGGMKGKPGYQGGIPGMRIGPKEAKLIEHIPLVNGTPMMQIVQKMPPEVLKKFGELHDKFGEFSKSKLTYTVLPGSQAHDIILK